MTYPLDAIALAADQKALSNSQWVSFLDDDGGNNSPHAPWGFLFLLPPSL